MSHFENLAPTNPEQNNQIAERFRNELEQPGPPNGNLPEVQGGPPPNMMDQPGNTKSDVLPGLTITENGEGDVNVEIHINGESCNDAAGEGSGRDSAEKQGMPDKEVTDPFGPKGPPSPEELMNFKSNKAPDGTFDKEVRPSVEPNGLLPEQGQPHEPLTGHQKQSESMIPTNQSII